MRPFPPKNVQYLFRRAENFTATLMDIKSRGIYSMIIDVRPENLTAFLRAVRAPALFTQASLYILSVNDELKVQVTS